MCAKNQNFIYYETEEILFRIISSTSSYNSVFSYKISQNMMWQLRKLASLLLIALQNKLHFGGTDESNCNLSDNH